MPDIQETWEQPCQWLAGLSDDTPISRINIPGTHDTAAIDTRNPPTNPYACQRISVTTQLEGGIRLLDVRLKVSTSAGKYTFLTCHGNIGGWLGLNEFQCFPSLLDECGAFLKRQNTEAILMSLKIDDWNGCDNHKEDVLAALSDLLEQYARCPPEAIGTSIPTLGQIRGKMLCFNRINEHFALGIPIHWTDNTSGALACRSGRGYDIFVQDQYKDLPSSDAVSRKLALVTSAFGEKTDENIVWNFASATVYGVGGVYIMRELLEKFGEKTARNRYQQFGWVLFDDPFRKYMTDKYGSLDITNLIIASNTGYAHLPAAFSVISAP